jgi:hypothetical protein
VRLEVVPGGFTAQNALTNYGPVSTTTALVERIEPTGSDAKVWQRMQEIANGRWAPPQTTITNAGDEYESMIARGKVWSEILTKYPDSNYVPYAVVAHDSIDVKAVIDAIKRFRDHPSRSGCSSSVAVDAGVVWSPRCGRPGAV